VKFTWIQTEKAWLLILNQSHLEHVLAVFTDHYNGHRPHRALGT
jgi:hypothetical protein